MLFRSPHGNGNTAQQVLRIDNPAISLSAFYENDGSYTLRLINNNSATVAAVLTLLDQNYPIMFNSYEVKTFEYAGGDLIEKEIWI